MVCSCRIHPLTAIQLLGTGASGEFPAMREWSFQSVQVQPICNSLQPNLFFSTFNPFASNLEAIGLQPNSNGLQPSSDGLQPRFGELSNCFAGFDRTLRCKGRKAPIRSPCHEPPSPPKHDHRAHHRALVLEEISTNPTVVAILLEGSQT